MFTGRDSPLNLVAFKGISDLSAANILDKMMESSDIISVNKE